MACPAFVKSKSFRITASVVLLLIVSGIIYGYLEFTRQHSDISKVKPDFTLNASDLYSEFEGDELSATAKYSGKIIELSGKVAEIEYSSADSTLSITLREVDQFSGVICTFSEIKDATSSNVNAGEQITVRGECSGMLMDVLLNNCVLINEK